MIKLHASFTKKVPAEQEYSSKSCAASIELEVPDQDLAVVRQRLQALWAELRGAVESELNGQNGNGHGAAASAIAPTSRVEPMSANGGRRGGNPTAPASQKQINFLLALGSRPEVGDVREVARRMVGKTLDQLTRAEASRIIDAIQKQGAGNGIVAEPARGPF